MSDWLKQTPKRKFHLVEFCSPATHVLYKKQKQKKIVYMYTEEFGPLSFQAAAPLLWDALPEHLRVPQTVETFKKHLKTILLRKAFI